MTLILNGGSIESYTDASHQAKETESQKGHRESSQTGEKTEEAKRERTQYGGAERTTRLAFLTID